MASKAKQRARERQQAEANYLGRFLRKLEAVSTLADAKQLAYDMPPPDAVGRLRHTSLQCTLETFAQPSAATAEEREAHLALLLRLMERGEITAEHLAQWRG